MRCGWQDVLSDSSSPQQLDYLQTHTKFLERRAGAFPKYDTDYQTVDECQTACVTQVFDCNTVNYSP